MRCDIESDVPDRAVLCNSLSSGMDAVWLAERNAGVLYEYLGAHPQEWKWQNYTDAWERGELGRKYLNSILVLVATLAIVIPAVCCAAYAIARTDFRFKKGIYFYLLLGLCIPTGVLAIPIFSVALKYKLVNSYWGVILFGAAQCMGVRCVSAAVIFYISAQKLRRGGHD